MRIYCKQFKELCTCGKRHGPYTKHAVVEAGCMDNMEAYLLEFGLMGKRAVLYDEVSYHARGLARPNADIKITLPYGTKCEETAVEKIRQRLSNEKAEVLIAIGSATVHSLAKIAAASLAIPLVSCPTSASTDAYCTRTVIDAAGMTHEGALPVLVIADMNVIAKAPGKMVQSGIGCVMAKAPLLVDMRIRHLLRGEAVCPLRETLLRSSVVTAIGCAESAVRGDVLALTQLMYSLLLSGVASQIDDGLYPVVSTAAHMEMLLLRMPWAFKELRSLAIGERMGVYASLVMDAYRAMGKLQLPALHQNPIDRGMLEKQLGNTLYEKVMLENKRDCLSGVDEEKLSEVWGDIKKEIAAMLDVSALAAVGRAFVISSAEKKKLRTLSPLMKNQATLLRLSTKFITETREGRSAKKHGRKSDRKVARQGTA